MYKVFINNKPLIITSTEFLHSFKEKNRFEIESGKDRDILFVIEKMTFDKHIDSVVMYADDVDVLWKKFCRQFEILEAAGGIVFNGNKDVLMIYRFDKWDLPKGKIEKGETPDVAALREVCEETGVCDCKITEVLSTTYHTYQYHGKFILKRTFWYEMYSEKSAALKAQAEEGITEAKWMSKNKFESVLQETYPSIKELLSKYC